ncbi:hypothetical protein SAMN04488522_11031 [Pedobacter caeni]|uniref:Uncharacterized protein n=1 Tax=Pedobacter caeni TaxID=288992 RepID=A0A1M5PPK9_9SPHI|nr:hypothetical protein SAMN04488522_11031 [Pedobacter caeni]
MVCFILTNLIGILLILIVDARQSSGEIATIKFFVVLKWGFNVTDISFPKIDHHFVFNRRLIGQWLVWQTF